VFQGFVPSLIPNEVGENADLFQKEFFIQKQKTAEIPLFMGIFG